MEDLIVNKIIKQYETLKSERANLESTWQEIAKYCLPRKAFITKQAEGQVRKAEYDIYDSTSIMSALILSAGLHSYLTNPSSKWFALRTQEEDLMNDHTVKVWLKSCEDRIYDALNSSNFAQQIHETYIDLNVFGTACLYEEEDPKTITRFYCRPISEIFISENEQERVDVVIRYFKLTARQAYAIWKKDAGEEVQKAIESKEFEKPIYFLHAVLPREFYQSGKQDKFNMPYASYYIEYSKKRLIAESGYREFPFFIPRFYKESNDIWGTSPAFVCFSDIKTVNQIAYLILRASQKIIDPPLVLPRDGFLLPIDVRPGSLNFRLTKSPDDRIEPLAIGANLPIGDAIAEKYREQIQKAFFVDLFLLLTSQPPKMTATEVIQRVEEKMLILAPVLGRLMSELLNPIIQRTFAILGRNGYLPPIPPILEGKEYTIEYISPLARAQKLQEIQSITQFMQIFASLAQMKGDILDRLNFDKLLQDVADIYKVPPAILRSDEEVEQIKQQRAQMEQLQQGLQAGTQIAQIAKAVGEAEKNARVSGQPASY